MTRTITLPLLLAACTSAGTPQPEPAVATPGTRCNSNAAAALIGRSADEVTEEARRLSGAASVRRYATGDTVTQDFRADRLNVETDAAGKVVRFSCG